MIFSPKKLWPILAVICLLKATPSLGLDNHQQRMVQLAYEVGGQTEVAIIEQESSVCRHRLGDYHHGHPTAFGCGQLHCGAVHTMFRNCPIHDLIYNDRFNIVVSAGYFAICLHKFGDWRRALVCYHSGPAAAGKCGRRCVSHDFYVLGIESKLHDFPVQNSPALIFRLRNLESR